MSHNCTSGHIPAVNKDRPEHGFKGISLDGGRDLYMAADAQMAFEAYRLAYRSQRLSAHERRTESG